MQMPRRRINSLDIYPPPFLLNFGASSLCFVGDAQTAKRSTAIRAGSGVERAGDRSALCPLRVTFPSKFGNSKYYRNPGEKSRIPGNFAGIFPEFFPLFPKKCLRPGFPGRRRTISKAIVFFRRSEPEAPPGHFSSGWRCSSPGG